MSVNVLYRAGAVATWGRDGHARSEDGRLDIQISTPKVPGGAGAYSNATRNDLGVGLTVA